MVIVGRKTEKHCFGREVGIGSKSQLVSGESNSILEISSMVTEAKEEKCHWWSNSWRRNMRRGASMIEEKTGVYFVNLIREKVAND